MLIVIEGRLNERSIAAVWYTGDAEERGFPDRLKVRPVPLRRQNRLT